MKHFNHSYSAQHMLEDLENQGLMQDSTPLSQAIIELQSDEELSLFMRILITLGGMIASSFFLAALVITGLIDFNATSIGIWGVLFTIVSLVIHNSVHSNEQKVFASGCAFSFMLIGQGLLAGAIWIFSESVWTTALGFLVIAAILYPLYKGSIMRFLSVNLVLVLLNTAILYNALDFFTLPYELFLLVQLILLYVVLFKVTSDHYKPMAYALIFSIAKQVFLLSFMQSAIFTTDFHLILIKISMVIWLLNSLAWIVGGWKNLNTPPLIAACIMLVLLACVASGGWLFAISLMVLGYAKQERLLTIIGVAMLGIFLSQYYYVLEMSLLDKSLTLIISGLMLLVARFYLVAKGWDKEAVCQSK